MSINIKSSNGYNKVQLEDFFHFVNQGKIPESVMNWFLIQQDKEPVEDVQIAKAARMQDQLTELHEPLVSIIIPTYNRRMMLEECLDSIFKQSYKRIEILIVNDHSSDDTDDFLSNLLSQVKNTVVFTNETNMNAGYNRNFAFQHARGKYIIFMDDDDFYIDPQFISNGVKKLEERDSLTFVSANSFIQNVITNQLEFHALNIKGLIKSSDYLAGFQTRYQKPLSTFTSIFRKSTLEDLGFKSMQMMNDVSIYLRALLTGEVVVMEDIIGVYRIHSNNLTNHLSADFMISNLQEKIGVYRLGINRTNSEIDIHWIDNQYDSTIRYYIRDSKAEFTSVLKVSLWMMKHCREIRKYSIFSSLIYWFWYHLVVFIKSNKLKSTRES